MFVNKYHFSQWKFKLLFIKFFVSQKDYFCVHKEGMMAYKSDREQCEKVSERALDKLELYLVNFDFLEFI